MTHKVLIIEDDEDDYVIMKHFLSKINTVKYDVYWCNDFDQAEQEILKDEHDIYLIDHFLGKGEGIEIIEKIRARDILKPLILLTGAGNFNVDEKAMEKGASDFIVKKEVRTDTLERSLRYAVERYNQQRFIREQEKKYRSLFELSMEPILILNRSFDILEFNAAFQRIFGHHETPQKHLTELVFSELFKFNFDFESIKRKLEKDGYVQGFKTTMLDGEKDITVIVSVAHLPGESEENEGSYHVAINDVSKLMEKESELQKMEKLSMTGRMARMIAHEVRNPLTNINLALGELSEILKLNEEARMFESMISRNTKRISTLIDDLLRSARPPELELVSSSLPDIVDSAIDFCQDRIRLLNIDFKKIFPSEDIEGRWDPEKLKIALVNIIINAIEAMDETPSPKLSVELTTEDESPVIFIRDNGKGMDESAQNSLYDPFYTNRKDGLGLGMTATLNIISMHNGRIVLHSEPGKGTEFKIML
ncbi:MAG: ATP-binding protein [Brumimicrobium sp.]|nr:ATP-binding protein [Brumimicrobium sp.]